MMDSRFLRFCVVSWLFLLANCASKPGDLSGPSLPFEDELLSAVRAALETGQGENDLGISAAVSVPGYRIWSGAAGNSQPGVPVRPDMLFDAGSIAKNFEAALVLRLVEDGRIDLDDPISAYLPDLPNVDGGITIRQLLNHTSGVFNVFEHPDFPWVGADVDYARSWSLEQAVAAFVLEPYGPPGHTQHYASTNYLLLTAVVEAATGVPVPDQVGSRFLVPLDLDHTFITGGEPLPGHFRAAHPWADYDLDGDLDDLFGIPLTWKTTLTHPVLYSTALDLTRWMEALYHDRTVLHPNSLDAMLTFPDVSMRDPEERRYGLGVVDYSDVLDLHAVGHAGSALGYSAAALYLPEFGVSMAWLINTGESPPVLASDLMGRTSSALLSVLQAHLSP